MKSTFFESIYNVFRFFVLILLIAVGCILFFFEVEFKYRSYNVIFRQRADSRVYYGLRHISISDLEIWKVKKTDNSGLSMRRVYPR